jgi:hypothetical protein
MYQNLNYCFVSSLYFFFSKSFRLTIFEGEQKFLSRLNSIFIECQSEERIPGELRHLLTENKGQSHQDAANEIQKYLFDKYDQKNWLVLVYDAVIGFDRHTLSG